MDLLGQLLVTRTLPDLREIIYKKIKQKKNCSWADACPTPSGRMRIQSIGCGHSGRKRKKNKFHPETSPGATLPLRSLGRSCLVTRLWDADEPCLHLGRSARQWTNTAAATDCVSRLPLNHRLRLAGSRFATWTIEAAIKSLQKPTIETDREFQPLNEFLKFKRRQVQSWVKPVVYRVKAVHHHFVKHKMLKKMQKVTWRLTDTHSNCLSLGYPEKM